MREIVSARTADIVEVTDVEAELKELKVTYVLLNQEQHGNVSKALYESMLATVDQLKEQHLFSQNKLDGLRIQQTDEQVDCCLQLETHNYEMIQENIKNKSECKKEILHADFGHIRGVHVSRSQIRSPLSF